MSTLRLLLVEDSPDRIAWFKERCPSDLRLVVVSRAGAAIGLVSRDPPGTYAGLLMDHDLAGGGTKNGADVARAVAEHIRPPVPTLVHTNSPGGGATIARVLDAAGFDVTRIAFEELTADAFAAWLDDVYDSSAS